MPSANDLFAKCVEFLTQPKTISADDYAIATEVFTGVSPAANAGPWIESDGRKLLQFSTNNYLGLAMHPEVRRRAMEIVEQFGLSCPMGSRLMTGNTRYHLELEEQIAAFKRREAALIFTAGAMATMGSIACLAKPGDLLILDEYAHSSLVCGAKISGAEIRVFRHNDVDHLQSVLQRLPVGQCAAVVIDGVYSMQGDVAPLTELVELKNRYGVRLIVDDAHATGVFGPNGRGTAAHFGVQGQIDLEIGTFSKALATLGGFVAGDRAVVEYIRYNAPTMVFTKAMPLAIVAATQAALGLLVKADDARRKLWDNTRRLQAGLRSRGFQIGHTQSPITPIECQGTDAIHLAHDLRKTFGIWVSPVVYPAVPLGKSIIRVIPTALHSDTEIDYLIQSLATVRGSMVLGALPFI
jgi:8-amino-7-oxononanoate synthase